MSLLGSAGFDLYLSDPMNLTAQVSAFTSPLLSPAGDDDISVNPFELHSLTGSGRNSIDTEGGIVFTRSRSSTTGTSSSSLSSGSRSRDVHAPQQTVLSPLEDARTEGTPEPEPATGFPSPSGRSSSVRSHSHSPSTCDVRVLSADITCVGLSDDSADTWGLKIIKLVAFPELIVGPSGAPVAERRARPRTPSPKLLSALTEDMHIISFTEGEVGSGSDTTTRVAPESPKKDPTERTGSESPAFDDALDGDDSTDDDLSDFATRPKLRHLDTAQSMKAQNAPVRSRSRSQSTSSSVSSSSPLVPFFSFTRTSEGSSLAAPVNLLAALFPASERHMVMCSQELDVLDSRNASPERWAEEDEGSVEDEGPEGELPEPMGQLKCLQIDLRKFGLGECPSTAGQFPLLRV